jgi:hypothetical protein
MGFDVIPLVVGSGAISWAAAVEKSRGRLQRGAAAALQYSRCCRDARRRGAAWIAAIDAKIERQRIEQGGQSTRRAVIEVCMPITQDPTRASIFEHVRMRGGGLRYSNTQLPRGRYFWT